MEAFESSTSELNDQRPDSPFQSDSSIFAQELESLVISCNNDNKVFDRDLQEHEVNQNEVKRAIDEEIQVMETKDDVNEAFEASENGAKNSHEVIERNILEDDLNECRVLEEQKGDESEIGGQNDYVEVDDGDHEEELKDIYESEIKNGDYSGEIGGYGWSDDGNEGGDLEYMSENAGGDWGEGGGGSITVPNEDDDDGILKSCHYPLRPDAEDCSYYIRTGMCKYGSNCKFNHPLRKRNQPNREIKKQREDNNHIEKPGEIECKFYLSGGCKYGKACKFNHGSRGKTVITPVLEYNFLGLPIRPGEKECPYYMRNGSCKYGLSCKFNHPDPTAVGGNDSHPPTTYGNEAHVPLQNTSQSNMHNMTIMPSWSAPRTPDPSAAFVPMMYPPTQNIPPPNQDWNGYQGPVPAAAHVYPSSERGLPIPPAFFLNNPPSDTNLYTHHQQQHMLISDYPERPGQPECSYFMKTGDCKYRSGCKFHHPKNRIARTAPSVLSDKGLPLRPDQNICSHYSRYGICKYGPACKYDHPVSYSNPAAASGEGRYRSDGDRPLIQQSV